MLKTRYSNIRTGIIVAMLILIAALCRHQKHFGLGNDFNYILRPLRVVIYLGLFIVWGIYVDRRIINRQLRAYLRAITCMMIFWFSERTVRMHFVLHQGIISRTLWYSSYIPIILIPTFMLFAAMHTRKDDDYRLPEWSPAVTAVSVLFSAIIATNDLHYRIFSPKGTLDMLESWYSYTPLYWIIVGWIIVLLVSALGIIFRRCRVPHSRRVALMPIVIMMITAGYFIFMMIDYRSWKWLFGDYTPFLCLAVTGIIESCLQSGMIPANTGYEELFYASPIGLLIVDDNGRICFRTAQAADIRPESLADLESGTERYSRNMVLQKYKLSTGSAIWQEDITELADTIEDLENNRREIAEANYLSEHTYRTVSRLRHTQEQNRLYDVLQKQTASQNRKMQQYLEEYGSCGSEEERRRLLADSAVIAAYIKRKGNLLFHGEKSGIIPTEELRLCIEESLQNVRLLGAECSMDIRMPGGMTVASAIKIFDLYETVVEAVMNDAEVLYVRIGDRDAKIRVRIECELGHEAKPVPLPSYAECEAEGDLLSVTAVIDDMEAGGGSND